MRKFNATGYDEYYHPVFSDWEATEDGFYWFPDDGRYNIAVIIFNNRPYYPSDVFFMVNYYNHYNQLKIRISL
jgi:hypothetical protein